MNAFVLNSYQQLYAALNCSLQQDKGTVFGATGIADPFINGVLDYTPTSLEETADTIEKVASYFKNLQLPYIWIVNAATETPHLAQQLQEKGFKLLGALPAMELDISQVHSMQAPENFTVEPLSESKTFAKWAKIVGGAFHMKEESYAAYQSILEKRGFNGPFFHLIGKEAGEPVCTGTLLVTPEGGYIYNIATEESKRGHGYAGALVSELIELAKAKGCKKVALVSMPLAAPLYARMGFKQLATYHFYWQN